MNVKQRQLLADELRRVDRYGWTVIESTIVPAHRNLLGAHRDVAVVLCDDGTHGPHGYRVSLTAMDMFAGSHGGFDHLDDAMDYYRSVTGDHAATQQPLF
jgi:hypothetical protein